MRQGGRLSVAGSSRSSSILTLDSPRPRQSFVDELRPETLYGHECTLSQFPSEFTVVNKKKMIYSSNTRRTREGESRKEGRRRILEILESLPRNVFHFRYLAGTTKRARARTGCKYSAVARFQPRARPSFSYLTLKNALRVAADALLILGCPRSPVKYLALRMHISYISFFEFSNGK